MFAKIKTDLRLSTSLPNFRFIKDTGKDEVKHSFRREGGEKECERGEGGRRKKRGK